MLFEKTKINEKEAGDSLFKEKTISEASLRTAQTSAVCPYSRLDQCMKGC